MTTINYLNPRSDLTVQIFDAYQNFQQGISAEEYDVVYSYLLSVFNTKQQAGSFTVTFFRIADATGIPALTLLQQIQGLNGPEINLTFAYYLNSFQSPSTMLGVQVPAQPNFYVAHNIKQ